MLNNHKHRDIEQSSDGLPHQVSEEYASGDLWPSKDYAQQINRLKKAIGKKCYVIELRPTETSLSVHYETRARELVAVVDFPKPEPKRGLYPHNIMFDDGSCINLGRIARVSTDSAFTDKTLVALYKDKFLLNKWVFRKRQLSKASIASHSRKFLGQFIGK